MGYALLPDNELAHFAKLLEWINKKTEKEDFQCLEAGLSFGNLGNALELVSASLLRRTNHTEKFRTSFSFFARDQSVS